VHAHAQSQLQGNQPSHHRRSGKGYQQSCMGIVAQASAEVHQNGRNLCSPASGRRQEAHTPDQSGLEWEDQHGQAEVPELGTGTETVTRSRESKDLTTAVSERPKMVRNTVVVVVVFSANPSNSPTTIVDQSRQQGFPHHYYVNTIESTSIRYYQ